MSILIIEQDGRRQAGVLSGRVLIGRMDINTVVVDDRSVSRIHAWIGVQNGSYYVSDSGSRTGTFLNGRPVRNRHVLSDGDEIYIGPLRLTYHSDAKPPLGTEQIDLAPRSQEELSVGKGMFMECACGAPLWMPRTFFGAGQCRHCGNKVERRQGDVTPVASRRAQVTMPAQVAAPDLEPEPEPEAIGEPAGQPQLDPLAMGQDDSFDDLLEESLPSAMVPDSVEEPEEQTIAMAPVEHVPPAPASTEDAPLALEWDEIAPIALASDEDTPVSLKSTEDVPLALASGDDAPLSFASTDDGPLSLAWDEDPPRSVASVDPAPHAFTSGEDGPIPIEEEPQRFVLPPEPATTAVATTQKKTTEKTGKKPPKSDPMCGVCHSTISIFEETAECPSCGLPFHTDCWAENRGCSAYGCPQVGALEEKAPS
ncbi:MAG: hypothetical protein JWN51_2657 [Phycisphaerales bacterium]|nr:hypothetical protein [Phycisphaerales bacterium]